MRHHATGRTVKENGGSTVVVRGAQDHYNFNSFFPFLKRVYIFGTLCINSGVIMTDVHICLVGVTLAELESEFDVVMSHRNHAKVLKLCVFECGCSYRLSGLEVSDSVYRSPTQRYTLFTFVMCFVRPCC
jgi:hypothetical protein